MDLTPDLTAELLIRIVATAAIVIGISLAVERLGPLVGGALVGLPIVIGPGFFFLIQEHGRAFSAAAAAASLISLCATQGFLLAFCATAGRARPAAALAVASGAWFALVVILSNLPPDPLLGLALFLAATGAARGIGRRFVTAITRRRGAGGIALLILRGVAAGLLVAAATVAAEALGPAWSGFIVTYPIGFTVISITLHQRVGAATAIATMHAAMLGVGSLAAFSFTLSATIVRLGPVLAFTAALAAGVAVTTLLTWRSAILAGRTGGQA